MNQLRKAEINYRRALTRHENAQAKGLTDRGVRQTRRMALAVAALDRAAFKLADARHAERAKR